jgi:hypothetical protein
MAILTQAAPDEAVLTTPLHGLVRNGRCKWSATKIPDHGLGLIR